MGLSKRLLNEEAEERKQAKREHAQLAAERQLEAAAALVGEGSAAFSAEPTEGDDDPATGSHTSQFTCRRPNAQRARPSAPRRGPHRYGPRRVRGVAHIRPYPHPQPLYL